MNAATAPTSRPSSSASRYTGSQPERRPIEPESSSARRKPVLRHGDGPWSSRSQAAVSTCDTLPTVRTTSFESGEIVLEEARSATGHSHDARYPDSPEDRTARLVRRRRLVHEG